MVNRTVILSRKGEVGTGCCINWKVQCSFVFLWTWDEIRGERAGSKPVEMSERVWAWAACDPGSSLLGTGAPVPAYICQGLQANQIGQDSAKWHPALQQRGSLSPVRRTPLSIGFSGKRTSIGWRSFKSMLWFPCLLFHVGTLWGSVKDGQELVQIWWSSKVTQSLNPHSVKHST